MNEKLVENKVSSGQEKKLSVYNARYNHLYEMPACCAGLLCLDAMESCEAALDLTPAFLLECSKDSLDCLILACVLSLSDSAGLSYPLLPA